MRKQGEQETIQVFSQSPAQQQQCWGETQIVNGSVLCPINNDPLVRQNWVTSNRMASKLNEARLKRPLQGNALHDTTIKVLCLFKD